MIGPRVPRLLLDGYSLLLMGFILAPVVTLVWMSFNDGGTQSFPISGYSLPWYASAFQNQDYRVGVVNSLAIAAPAAPMVTGLAAISAH